jgi:hypothetical protein
VGRLFGQKRKGVGCNVESHQAGPVVRLQITDHAKIHCTDDFAGHHYKVAGVGVGVEEAVFQHLFDDDAGAMQGHPLALL